MKIKKLKALLISTLMSLSLLTGCSGPRTLTAVTDNTLYQSDTDNTTPCYLNNVTMNVDNGILDSDTLRGFVDSYTLELYDDGAFVLLCNMYQHSLDEMDATDARDCLLDYFEGTAVSLNLDKVNGKYVMAKDISPLTGKEADFYKIVFSGAKIKVEDVSLEGEAALIAYEDICVAAVIGSADGKISSSAISNMMKSVAVIESSDLSTGKGSKPSYEVPDDLMLDTEVPEEEAPEEDAPDREVPDEDEPGDEDDFDDPDDEDDKDEDGDTHSSKPSSKEAKASDVLATSLTIDGIEISYPTSYDDLADSGFIPGEEGDYIVPANDSEIILFALDDGGEFNVFFRNTTDADLPLSDCTVYGLDVDTYYLSDSTTVIIGKSIVMGETTKDELTASAPMEPSYEYDDSDSYYSVTYEDPDDFYFYNDFKFIDGILTEISMYFTYDD